MRPVRLKGKAAAPLPWHSSSAKATRQAEAIHLSRYTRASKVALFCASNISASPFRTSRFVELPQCFLVQLSSRIPSRWHLNTRIQPTDSSILLKGPTRTRKECSNQYTPSNRSNIPLQIRSTRNNAPCNTRSSHNHQTCSTRIHNNRQTRNSSNNLRCNTRFNNRHRART